MRFEDSNWTGPGRTLIFYLFEKLLFFINRWKMAQEVMPLPHMARVPGLILGVRWICRRQQMEGEDWRRQDRTGFVGNVDEDLNFTSKLMKLQPSRCCLSLPQDRQDVFVFVLWLNKTRVNFPWGQYFKVTSSFVSFSQTADAWASDLKPHQHHG